jgi:hypothetical protein
MSSDQDDVEAFLADVAESRQLWRSIDLRVLAVRCSGTLHNLVSRCVLDGRPAEALRGPKFLPDTPDLVALHEGRPIDDLPSLIEDVRSGVLRVRGREIRFLGRQRGDDVAAPYADTSHWRASTLANDLLGDFRTGHMLTLRGGRNGDLFRLLPQGLEGLNRQLRRLARPWSGLDALTLHGIGEVRQVSNDSSSRIHFVAPLPAALFEDECTLSDEVLRFSVLAGSARLSCVLGLFGQDHNGEIVSRSLPLGAKRWRRAADGYALRGRVAVPRASELTLMLHVADQAVATLRVRNRSGVPPVLLTVAQALIPEARRFEQYLLDPEPSESREFERAVTRLFTLCGFTVDGVGDAPKTSNTVDAVAMFPDGSALFTLECTTGPLNNEGKLGKLVRRSAQVRGVLADANISVLPVMVSSWSESEASSSEVEAAEADGITVVWREQLGALLRLAMSRAPVEEAIALLAPARRSIWDVWGKNPLALERAPAARSRGRRPRRT